MAKHKQVFSDEHHHWWPARDYTSPLEVAFRSRPCAKSIMDRAAHTALHKYQSPPRKPDHDFMANAVEKCRTGGCSICSS